MQQVLAAGADRLLVIERERVVWLDATTGVAVDAIPLAAEPSYDFEAAVHSFGEVFIADHDRIERLR